ncbi:amino acid adenylation domain-containing protein [Roseivirga sp. BDSF3-8]|uniref:amino acid adenylation domain-containing protein n=1 Tax=Roseivirga sp. BDSF3-8 TaxID=3241598 RepID=UPI003531A99D
MSKENILRKRFLYQYWIEKISAARRTVSPLTALDLQEVTGADMPTDGACTGKLPVSVSQAVTQMAKGNPLAISALCMAATRLLVARYFPEDKGLLASPPALSTPGEAPLFYQIELQEQGTARDLLIATRQEIKEAMGSGDYDFETLLTEADSLDPVTSGAFTFTCRHEGVHAVMPSYAGWQFTTALAEGTLELSFSWQHSPMHEAVANQIHRHFINLLAQIVADPAVQLSAIVLADEIDVAEFAERSPEEETALVHAHVAELFTHQVEQTPAARALVFGETVLTYDRLGAEVDRLAACLASRDVHKRPVGVLLSRSHRSVIAMMAILKAGGVYLPLDTALPQERLRTIVDMAQPALILTEEEVAGLLNGSACPRMAWEALEETYPAVSMPVILPEDPAYLIYTSGSTGVPKGVEQTHKTLINLMEWQRAQSGIDTGLSYLQYVSFGFDVALQDVAYVLGYGGELHVLPQALKLDFPAIAKYVADHDIATLSLPCSVLTNIFADKEHLFQRHALRHIITAGEQLMISPALADFLKKNPEVQLHNHYGPTESHVVTTHTMCAGTGPLPVKAPIGKPVQNTRIYILDASGRQQPAMLPGELFITGHHLANGYLNEVERTEEKFRHMPLAIGETERVYATGDLARWLPDGTIEYLGRVDNQVKVRGNRVELGEVERALLRIDSIAEAAVVLRHHADGSGYLAAFYTAGSEAPGEDTIQVTLSASLPDYMVPSVFEILTSLPLNPNGKVDRKLLSRIEITEKSGLVEPRSDMEVMLLGIFRKLLERDDIGITDNFFTRGGHSLKAMRVISHVLKETGVEVNLKDFFANPTVIGLSELLAAKGTDTVYSHLQPLPEAAHYALSHSQKRLWLLQQANPADVAYNMPYAYRLEGALDLDAFRSAWQTIVERHEVLRTIFPEVKEGPVQKVIPVSHVITAIPLEDVQYSSDPEALVREANRTQASKPFDLTGELPFRISLWQTAEDTHILLLTLHHIVCDGWSMEILQRDWLKVYHALIQDESPLLPGLPIQYKDFAHWQNSNLEDDRAEAHLAYWQRVFSEEIPSLDLFSDNNTDAPKETGTTEIALDESLVSEIEACAAAREISPFTVVFSALNALLYRYTGRTDIVIGSPVAGRQHPDLEDLIGVFINTIPFRTRFSEAEGFDKLIDEAKEVMMGGLEHQVYPYDLLVEKVSSAGTRGSGQLYEVGVSWHDTYTEKPVVEQGSLGISPFDGDIQVAKAPVWWHGFYNRGSLSLGLEYEKDRISDRMAEGLLAHLVALLREAMRQPSAPIASLSYFTSGETEELRRLGEGLSGHDADLTVIDIWNKNLPWFADLPAVSDSVQTLSYARLEELSNQLARHMREECAIRPGDRVALLSGRSSLSVVAMLAILKAQAAYVPFETDQPEARLQAMTEDASPAMFMTDMDHLDVAMGNFQGPLFALDLQLDSLTDSPDPLKLTGHGDQLAYIMYTSGSTGMPKGVMVPHRAIVRLVEDPGYVMLSAGDRLLQTGSMAFDAATFEIWGMLLNGGSVHLSDKEDLVDTGSLKEMITSKGITTMWMTSAWFNQVLDTDITLFQNLQHLLAGGDKLSPSHIARLRNQYPDLNIINGYGPTENTTFSLCHSIEESDGETAIPIGRPVRGTSVHLLDHHMQPVPAGVPGEICFSGTGLATGYLNNPELTAEKFITDQAAGTVYYKSGDIGRWREDGTLAFLGRKDDQVKIRGFRLETGEIENAIEALPEIEQAVVVRRHTDQGELFLAAYYTGAFPAEDLRKSLHSRLPSYMMPAHLEQVETIPLTRNGKADRKVLAERPLSLAVTTLEEGNGVTEKVLLDIFRQVLNRQEVGIHDDFFDKGGHSLRAMQLVAEVKERLGVEARLRHVFEMTDVYSLAQWLDTQLVADHKQVCPVEDQTDYPLSHSQQRLWMYQQTHAGDTSYHMPFLFRIEGALDITAFKGAWKELVKRHESLRTLFRSVKGEARQIVLPPAEATVPVHIGELIDCSSEAFEEEVKSLIADPFRLDKGPLFRLHCWPSGVAEHTVLLVIHHIICDGWSLGVLQREFLALYESQLTHAPDSLPKMEVQYRDFAVWEQSRLAEGSYQIQKEFWNNLFSGELPSLNLPLVHHRQANGERKAASTGLRIESAVYEEAIKNTRGAEASAYSLVLTAIKSLLYHYTHQTDIVVGSPVAGRTQKPLHNQIGFFVNTLALRSQIDPSLGFIDVLKKEHQAFMTASDHQEYPFDLLVKDLDVEIDRTRHPLFDVGYSWHEGYTDGNDSRAGITLHTLPAGFESARADLWWHARTDDNGDLLIGMDYDASLFDEAFISRLLGHFKKILKSIADKPGAPVSSLSYMDEGEKNRLMAWARGSVAPAAKETVTGLFEKVLKAYPDHVAVELGDVSLNYSSLNERANRVAACLVNAHNVKPGAHVALLVNRSLQVPAIILGILKAGAAYVPVDDASPVERIGQIISDAEAAAVIYDKDLAGSLPDSCPPAISSEELFHYSSKGFTPVTNGPDDLAYIMYTSGSTGKPKGVMVPHRGIARLVHGTNFVPLGSFTRSLPTSSLAFDGVTFEFFGPLLNGGTIVMVAKEDLLNPRRLAEIIEQKRITHMWMTSSWLNQVIDEDPGVFASLEYLLAGGDKLSPNHLGKLREACPDLLLINGYGPTENTTFSLCHTIEEIDPEGIPLGKPIRGTSAYILDSHLQPVGEGIEGQLYLGGDGLALGYMNDARQTEERFIPNPFGEGCLYASGDRGKWLPGGIVAFCGRMDDQLKIRGYRIEPGEIETLIEACEGVDQALVLPNRKTSEITLAAFYSGTVEVETLKGELLKKLPAYMVPGCMERLEALPLNRNGKVDRSKLLEMIPSGSGIADSSHSLPVSDPVLSRVLDLFREILANHAIGPDDDFFNAGGHSLKGLTFTSRIYKEYGIDLTLTDLFEYPTALTMAERLKEENIGKLYTPIEPVPESEDYVLSHSQKRVWILQHMNPELTAYNMSFTYRVEGDFTDGEIALALRTIVQRHESFRTVFIEKNGEPRQQIIPFEDITLAIDIVQAAGEEEALDLMEQKLREQNMKPFDLSAGLLLRMALVRVDDQNTGLCLTLHHIIGDGWSLEIFTRELQTILLHQRGEGPAPEALAIQYKDFAAWQQHQLSGSGLATHRAYWHERFCTPIPVLDMPLTYERPASRTYAGETIHHTLDKGYAHKMLAFARNEGASVHSLQLAVVNALLYRYTGQNDIVLGLPATGRSHPDLAGQIGFFMDTIALRTVFDGGDKASDLVHKTHKRMMEAFTHQAYPFDKLVEDIQLPSPANRHPLFDVMVINQIISDKEATGGHLPTQKALVKSYQMAPVNNEAKFDITVSFFETDTGLELTIQYNKALFSKPFVQDMMGHLLRLLDWMLSGEDCSLDETAMLSAAQVDSLPVTDKEAAAVSEEDFVTRVLRQASLTLEAPAVLYEGHRMTYDQLVKMSGRLANYLMETGLKGNGETVALCLRRTDKLPVVLLGILRAGAAFLPLDPEHPAESIAYKLQDAGAAVLLTDSGAGPDAFEGTALALDAIWGELESYSPDVFISTRPESLAYVLYTSGSTGRPKGVAITRANFSFYINWADGYYFNDQGGHHFPVFTSIAFDLTYTSIFSPLLRGDFIRLYDQADVAESLKAILLPESGLTAIKLTPSHVQMIDMLGLERTGIGTAIIGGEALRACHVAILKKLNPAMRVFNEYGPTETTVGCTIKEIEADADITIGKPISGAGAYIMRNGHLQPVGVPGELAISGRGVGQGYVNRPDMTAERFIDNPFGRGKLYRTGDLCKYLPNGEIAYLGRIDHQVKIRGYRIEPGETEEAISQCPGVDEAIVVVQGTVADPLLAGYFTGTSKAEEVMDILRQKLPAYMIPSRLEALESLPLTPNGKVDRASLQAREVAGPVREIRQLPVDATEAMVAEVFAAVLGLDSVGTDEDFFSLGGHSLKAMQAINSLTEKTNKDLSIRSIFQFPTASGLAEHLKQKDVECLTDMPLAEEKDKYPATHGQTGLYLKHRFKKSAFAFNMMEQEVMQHADMPALRQALAAMISRHESLRTRFSADDEGKVWQHVIPAAEMPELLCEYDLREREDAAEVCHQEIGRHIARRFDHKTGPLMMVYAYHLPGDETRLCLVIDHIISDAWSMQTFRSELLSFYTYFSTGAAELPASLPVQLKDYAVWQQAMLAGPGADTMRTYWHDLMRTRPEALKLPYSFEKAVVTSHRERLQRDMDAYFHQVPVPLQVTMYRTLFNAKPLENGGAFALFLHGDTYHKLTALADGLGISMFALLTASLYMLAGRLSGQRDICLGSPVTIRNRPELNLQLGWFLDTLLLRTTLDPHQPTHDFLKQVNEENAQAMENRLYPFEYILEDLDVSTDLVGALFIHLIDFTRHGALPESKKEAVHRDKGTPTFDLNFTFHQYTDGLQLIIDYRPELFTPSRIEDISGIYLSLLGNMASDTHRSVITLLSDA